MKTGASSSTFAQGCGGQASKASLGFGEDVPASLHYAVARKKRLRLLSEVVLRTVKRRLPSSPYGLRRDKCVFVRHFFGKKNGGSVFAHPGYAGTRREGFDTRAQPEVSVSIADLRSRSAGQPIKKSRFLRHAESCNVKMKNSIASLLAILSFIIFTVIFCPPPGKEQKKMAEREGFEPSIILLVKPRLKRCFIPPFERKFLKF